MTKKEDIRKHKFIERVFGERIADDLLELEIRTFDCDLEQGEGAYVHGESNAGKTVCVAESIWQLKLEDSFRIGAHHVIFSTAYDMLRDIMSGVNNKLKTTYDQEEVYRNVKLLVIDDIGTRLPSDWAYEVLYGIINFRYENKKPTIYTSNLSLEQLEEVFDSRLASRIARSCVIVEKTHWDTSET